ncbi:MAG: RNA polymerase sigma factor [Spirochaetaceae bacterium]|nr:MAG: RNA polymerase sigma factor [Spirochaetaceae bacterium]
MENLLAENPLIFVTRTDSPEDSLVRTFFNKPDPAIYEKIVMPHLPWLKRLLVTVFNGDRQEMEDALQEILLSFITDIKKFGFKSSFKTFFYSYSRNKAVDMLRKQVRMRKQTEKIHLCRGTDGVTPETELLRKEESLLVRNALAQLEADERIILVQKDVEGFSIEELSAMYGLPQGTVKSRLSRTREKLAKAMKEAYS